MADTTVSRLGQINTSGDALALFLKKFAGEVLTAFHETQIMMNKHMIRTISSGKSAQFPVTGTATANYLTPGKNILDSGNSLLNEIKHAEKIINVDALLTANTFIYELDEAMNHYDVRHPYSQELGEALAERFDKNVIQKVILAARETTPTITGGDAGTVLNKGASVETDAQVLADSIAEGVTKLREKKANRNQQFWAVVRPAEYSMLANEPQLQNREFGADAMRPELRIMKVGGATVVESLNLPDSNISANSGENNTYNGDFSNTVSAVFTNQAVGTVRLRDLAMESDRKIEYQGTLFVAKYAMGHGTLRPERAVEITKASS